MFKNSIAAAGSLAGSPENTRGGVEAFVHIALVSSEVAVSFSGNWSSGLAEGPNTGTGRRRDLLEGVSSASPFHCGPSLDLAFSPASHPGRNILFPYCIFPAALMFSPCRPRPSAPGGRCWGISHLLRLLGNGRAEPVPSYRSSSVNCCQPAVFDASSSQTSAFIRIGWRAR